MRSGKIFDKIKKYSKKISIGIKCVWFYFWGNVFADFIYDRKYLSGNYFSGKYGGITAVGWRWAVYDGLSRIFLGTNRGVPYPISPKMCLVNPRDIHFCVDDLNNFQSPGNYYQAAQGAKIVIGKGCWIAPNVGLITTNHDINNPENHVRGRDIILGEKCWIGMNSVILPGTVLGSHTTVGAGSVVTHSFPDGFCVIAGNPAKMISSIDLTETGTSK